MDVRHRLLRPAALAAFSYLLGALTLGPVFGATTTVHLAPGDQITVIADTPAPTATPTPTPTPVPTPTPTAALNVAQFPGTGANTQAAFMAMAANLSNDVIEMAGGTYSGWHLGNGTAAFPARPATDPLLVRPASGATVTFDGGNSSTGLMYFGLGAFSSYITFDGAFRVQNYKPDSTGIIWTGYVDHIAVNGFTAVNVSGTSGSSSWVVYVSSDGTHRGTNLTFDRWNVTGPTDKSLSGFQGYHDPQADTVHVGSWSMSNVYNGLLVWGNALNVTFEGNTITNCNRAISTSSAAGVARNNTSTGCTVAPDLNAPFTDGGGNSWH